MNESLRRRFLLGATAPAGALVVAFLLSSAILLSTGHNPFRAFGAMGSAMGNSLILVNTLNQAITYYLSAVAVAIGFRMNLFNIGVDGQYRLAAMIAAAVAGATWMGSLPSFLRIIITLVVAMAVGAIWSGIAGFLKVTRGVSEVITTIMLNAIATALIAFLLLPSQLGVLQGNNVSTRKITDGGQIASIPVGGGNYLYTTVFLALLVGLAYAFLMNRTVFGFEVKATGLSESAAVASGVNVKKMMLSTMLISGALAGLVGMPELLNGSSASYSLNFPAGIGFTGIAIALLGRNHPIGMIFSALLWSALNNSSDRLQGADVPKEMVTIMQGIILFAVVIAYELVRRYRLTLEQKAVARALATGTKPAVAA